MLVGMAHATIDRARHILCLPSIILLIVFNGDVGVGGVHHTANKRYPQCQQAVGSQSVCFPFIMFDGGGEIGSVGVKYKHK